MAGFFDTLLGLENDPERRDYKRLEDISSPEELDAYMAGASATGIPGLDYARSMARGAKREITDPSMGPLGERYNEEMANYRMRQEAAERLRQAYPQAFRAGRLRGTEAIPGAEAGLMAQPGIAGAVSPLMRSAPAMAEREIAALPLGFDLAAESRSVEAPAATGDWGAIDRLQRTDRTVQPRTSIWPELRLNPHEPGFAPEAMAPSRPVSPKTPSAADISSQLDQPTQGSWSDIQPSDMNAKVRSILMRAEQSGQPLTSFEQNMVNNYFSSFKNRPSLDMRPNARLNLASPTMGVHGEAAENISENIAARQAAEEAKNERFANLPPVLQTNAFYKRANRLIEGADEARDFAYGKGRNSNFYRAPDPVILGMEEAAGYKPPPSPNSVPLLAQDRSLLNKALGIANNPELNTGLKVAGSAGTGFGIGALAGKRPPMADTTFNPNIPTSGMATPTMAQMYPVNPIADNPNVATDKKPVAPARPVRAAPARTAPAPRRTAPVRRPAASNEMYYGDYRDTEPFASDPIGSFIDELTGQRKTSRTRGTTSGGRGLGDLLPFENGGSVRSHFADGGTEDEGIPVLDSIGDALGGLFGEGKSDVVASDGASSSKGYLDRWATDPLSQLLFSSGLAMMAAPTKNPFTAIGMGGLKGLEYMRAAQSAQAAMREKEQERADRLRQLKLVEGLDAPVAQDAAPELPEAPEIVAPKTTATEAPVAEPTADVGTKTAAAATEDKPEQAAPVKEAPAAEPVAEKISAPIVATDRAEDSELRAKEQLHQKISRIMPGVTDPGLRASLANRQRSLEYEMNRIREDRKEAKQEQRLQQEAKIKQAEAERKAFEASPEGQMKKGRIEASQKQVLEDEADIRNTMGTLETLNAMESLLNRGMYSGPGSDIGSTLATSSFAPVSSDVRKKAENSREFDRISKDITYLAADKKLNAGTSNADIQFLKEKGPNLGLTVEGNRQAIDYARRAANRKIQITKFEQEYVKKHGYLDEGFYNELEKWGKENPLFSKEEKAKSKTSTQYEEGKIYPRGGKNFVYKNGRMYEVSQ